MAIVKSWWDEIDGGQGSYDIPIARIAEHFVTKDIFPDVEKAKTMIYKTQKTVNENKTLNYEQFNGFFCKGIFKSALQNVIDQLNDK